MHGENAENKIKRKSLNGVKCTFNHKGKIMIKSFLLAIISTG